MNLVSHRGIAFIDWQVCDTAGLLFGRIYVYTRSFDDFKLPLLKETRSVTVNIFRKKSFLFKSFVKIELSYVFTINMFSTAENCMEK